MTKRPSKRRIWLFVSSTYFVLFAAVLIIGTYILNKDYACEGCGRRVSIPEAHWRIDASGSGGWSCSPNEPDMKQIQGSGRVQNMSPQPAKEPLIIDR